MPIPVKRLILKRFRSVAGGDVEFANPTFLVGPNGSGKSNVASAFSFLAKAMSSPLQAVFEGYGGINAVRNRSSGGKGKPPSFGMGVVLGQSGRLREGHFAFEVKALPGFAYAVAREQCEAVLDDGRRYWFDRVDGKLETNVKGVSPSPDATSLCLPLVAGDERFAPVARVLAAMRSCSIEPPKMRDMQDTDSGETLRPDGSNGASVLLSITRNRPEDAAEISEILSTIVSHHISVRTQQHGNKLSFVFEQKWEKKRRLEMEAFLMSDGTLRALGMLLAVFQPSPASVLVIEEPEATIHPGALGAILDVIRHAAKKAQVIVTTHSPELLDAKWINDAGLRLIQCDDGATSALPPSATTRQAMRDLLMGAGELMRSNALAPEPATRPPAPIFRRLDRLLDPKDSI